MKPVDFNLKDTKFCAALFLFATATRLFFLSETVDSLLFYINVLPGTDMEGYIKWALSVSDGNLMGEGAFWQAPGYPYFLGITLRLFGRNLLSAAAVQSVLSSLTCVLIYATTKEAFNRKTAAAASLIACFYAPFIFYSAVLLSETLGLFLASAALLLLIKSLRGLSGTAAFASGIVYGLACLTRPNLLVFIPFFIVFLFIRLKNAKTAVKYSAWLAAGLAVSVSPAAIRNYLVADKFVLISGNIYETFRLSNSYDSVVFNYIEPELPLMPAGTAAFWLHQLKKAVCFWYGVEVPQNVNIYLFTEHSNLLALPLFPFWLIAPLGLAGVFSRGGRNSLQRCALMIFALSCYASVVPFYIISRLRLPFMIGIIPFAAFYTLETAGCFLRGNIRRNLPRLAAVLGIVLAIFPWRGGHIRGTDYRMLGMVMLREGRHSEASEYFGKYISLMPFAEDAEGIRRLIEDLESL